MIDALSRHTGQGRLTLDEFSDLAGRVYAARTRRDLDELLSDLPSEPEAVRNVAPPAAPERVDQRVGSRRRFVAVMCGTRARGRWRAPRRVTGFAFWGHAKVDLREAVIEEPVVDVTAWAIMGGVEVVVPDGIRVELDGLVVMGGSHNRVKSSTEPAASAPLIPAGCGVGSWPAPGGVARARPSAAVSCTATTSTTTSRISVTSPARPCGRCRGRSPHRRPRHSQRARATARSRAPRDRPWMCEGGATVERRPAACPRGR